MNTARFTLCAILLSLLNAMDGLTQTFEPIPVEVFKNEAPLAYPFTGGFNNPQLSEVDLNNDGIMDLYIFDRSASVHLTFLNDGVPNESSYSYAPAFTQNFPTLENWAMLRDYNGDGIQDLFSYSTELGIDGISAFTGYYENDTIAFEAYNYPFDPNFRFKVLRFPTRNGGSTQIFITRIDYPAIDDVDSDGDLDILTFNLAGGYVEWYKNISVERGYGLDSLIFELEDNCWGGFFESGITASIDLSAFQGDCVDGLNLIETRHAGSTLTTLNLDEDCDKELLLGDLSFDNLIALQNGGNCETAWMNEQDLEFPSNSEPAKVDIFPIAFHLDLNNDGKKDLVAAPNDVNGAENLNTIWYYPNQTDDLNPRFELQQRDLFVENTLDFGSGSNPTFVDYNGDGLLDIVVGTIGFIEELGKRDARLFLLENIGTPSSPAFELIDEDYLNLSQFSSQTWNFAPTFGDLDTDGDIDLLIGEEFGTLFWAENTSGQMNRIEITNIEPNFADIDVGLASSPHLTDLNGDGRLDLLIGERNGNVNYFENLGTSVSPMFSEIPNSEIFGRIDARVQGFFSGYSAPIIIKAKEKEYVLTGTEVGRLELYNLEADDFNSGFELLSETFGSLQPGNRSKPTVGDLNQDGWYDLLIGNIRGGLSLFSTNIPSGIISNTDKPIANAPNIFPNPASDELFVLNVEVDEIKLTNIFGQESHRLVVKPADKTRFLLPKSIVSGIYFVQAYFRGNLAFVQKIVVEANR